MKKTLLTTLILIGLNTFAQDDGNLESSERLDVIELGQACLDLEKIPSASTLHFPPPKGEKKSEGYILDKNDLEELCAEAIMRSDDDVSVKAIAMEPKKNWKILFSFGPFVTYYKKMDMRLQNQNTDILIRDLQPLQRTSFSHYRIWEGNPFSFIDEPQNRVKVELVGNGIYFGIEYLHPKILFHSIHDDPEHNNSVDIAGTFEGEGLNVENVPLSDYFFEFVSTHHNVDFQLYAGKIINLLGNNARGNLQLHIGAGVGIMLAKGVSKWYAPNPNGGRSLQIHEENKFALPAYTLSAQTKLRYTLPGDRVSVDLGYDYTMTRINGPIGGFQTQGNLVGHRVSLGVAVKVFQKRKPKIPKTP